ncbi:MAG: spore cortex biosynthesis protein YabQ [Clostridia bacterium]|nr:spore cortex biosynthesis protein YabQ [Clostridia bacterium]
MIYSQGSIFGAFFILGILTGFIFDFFRALRKTIKTNNIFTYIEDIIFFLIIGAMFLRSIIIFSAGELRFYIFIAIFLGIIIYILTIGNLCVIIFKVILDVLKKIILNFIRILKIPTKILKKVFKKLQRKIEFIKIQKKSN